jgi:hypothetical protein
MSQIFLSPRFVPNFLCPRDGACFEIIFGSCWLRQPIQKIKAHFLYRLQLSDHTKNE